MIPETPQIIKAPFAYNGDTRNIPATTPLGSNQFSFESGFPVLTQTPLNAGGLPPERIDFNSAFNVLSTFIYYMQSGNHFEWNNQLDYNAGAIVLGSDNALYYCIQANGATSPNTVQDPTTSPAYWIKIINNNGKINADNLSVTLGAFALLNKLDVSSDLIINSLNIQNGGTGATTAEQARSNLGLGNIDNTSDINKPISTATQNALNDKMPLAKASSGIGNVIRVYQVEFDSFVLPDGGTWFIFRIIYDTYQNKPISSSVYFYPGGTDIGHKYVDNIQVGWAWRIA